MKHTRALKVIAAVARSGSIRRAAERLNIAPSAVTRQIQDIEHELGTPLFERLPSGMRLNAAGELLARHIRDQAADLERVRSQIADLSGVRRGHVTIACSQAFATRLMPEEIGAYRAQFPQVRFTVKVRDHALGITALETLEADIALIVQPPHSADVQTVLARPLRVHAVMRPDHPLAGERGPLRLQEVFAHPTALPDHSLAVRHHLEQTLARRGVPLEPALESGSLEFLRNAVLGENLLSLQIPSGIPRDPPLVTRPVDARDLAPMTVILAQLRGRSLPVAAAKFADQLGRRLREVEDAEEGGEEGRKVGGAT